MAVMNSEQQGYEQQQGQRGQLSRNRPEIIIWPMDLFKMSFCPVFGFAALLRSALLNTKLDRQPRDTLVPHHDMWWEEAENSCIVQDTKQALHLVVKQWTENIKFGVWGTPAQQHKHCDNAERVLGKNFQSDLIIRCHFSPRSKCCGKCFVFTFQLKIWKLKNTSLCLQIYTHFQKDQIETATALRSLPAPA